MDKFFKVEIYEDKDNARRDEIAALGAGGPNNCFPAFYDRLKEVKIFYQNLEVINKHCYK